MYYDEHDTRIVNALEYVFWDSMSVGLSDKSYDDNSIITDEGVEITSYEYTRGKWCLSYKNTSQDIKTISVPIQCYDNYYVADSSGNQIMYEKDKAARIKFSVPADSDGEVFIDYREPLLWRVSEWVSFITILFVVLVLVIKKFGKRSDDIKRAKI